MSIDLDEQSSQKNPHRRILTVLGSSAAYPTPAHSCSGFLIEWDGYRIVLDLGYGTLPRLLAHLPEADLDAVVISHEHPDHCIDLHGLFRIRRYGPRSSTRLPVFCPHGVIDRLRGLEPDVPDVDMADEFDFHEIPAAHRLGPFLLSCIELPHFVPNVGVRLSTADAVIAYTGDTGPDPGLAELGADADMFIVDATGRPGEFGASQRNLLSASEAGRWATRAGAKRLMLTHFWPGNDRQAAAEEAGASFSGEILVAAEGLEIPLASRKGRDWTDMLRWARKDS